MTSADRRPRRPPVQAEQEGHAARRGRVGPAAGDERDAQGVDLAHRRSQGAAEQQGIQISRPAATWTYQLCGLGAELLDRLRPGDRDPRPARPPRGARGGALHVQVRAGDQVGVAFMPPPPGQTPSTLLYLQKEQLREAALAAAREDAAARQAAAPDRSPTRQEAATIDKLTLPAVYTYSLQQLQDTSALLVLDPVPDLAALSCSARRRRGRAARRRPRRPRTPRTCGRRSCAARRRR